ncbi:myeloid differentiation primary response protein MyD88 isoform X2 [Bacillus rossius redtenbacheri]
MGSEEIDGIDMDRVPLDALSIPTRQLLSMMLNPVKVIPTDDDLQRDWRGLAHLAGLGGQLMPLLRASADSTGDVLSRWQDGTAGRLVAALGRLDRWDVVDDSAQLMAKDAAAYARLQEHSESSAPVLDAEEDSQILTVGDVQRLKQGLKPQNYDAFLLFADEDQDFAEEIVKQLEDGYHFKLCVKHRDLVGGLAFEHKAIMDLIAERCNRLVVIISEDFLRSQANQFFVTFAQALGIDQRRRKVVPILYKQCKLPADLSYYFLLDYTRSGRLWDFWKKLCDSIHTPESRASLGQPEREDTGQTDRSEVEEQKLVSSSDLKLPSTVTASVSELNLLETQPLSKKYTSMENLGSRSFTSKIKKAFRPSKLLKLKKNKKQAALS